MIDFSELDEFRAQQYTEDYNYLFLKNVSVEGMDKSSGHNRINFTPRVKCETCPAIFSRKNCLHHNCPGHKADLAAFQRNRDTHIHAIVIRVWYPGTKAPGSSDLPETSNNAVSRDPSNHTSYSAQAPGDSFSLRLDTTSPGKLASLAQPGQSIKTKENSIKVHCSEIVGSNPAGRIPALTSNPPQVPDTTGAGQIFSKLNPPHTSCAHSNSLNQHHVKNRGSISQRMITPWESVFLPFPTPSLDFWNSSYSEKSDDMRLQHERR